MNGFGGAEVLQIGETEKPSPGMDQVLIKTEATSVNRPDIMQRQGNYPPPKGESEILGLEAAGIIEAVGPAVQNFVVGERVMALVSGGGYGEFVCAYETHLMRIPQLMDFEEAACVCETYLTAYLNLFLLGKLNGKKSVLLHGGGGGVNTAGVQLCKTLAPETIVIVTASPGKVIQVKNLGVDLVIDYMTEDFSKVVRDFTNGQGVDVILDHIGGMYLNKNMKALAVGGRLLSIGIMGGAKAEINLALLMVKRQQILGSVLRSRPIKEKGELIAKFNETVVPHLSKRKIMPLIHHVYPIEEVAEAHRVMEASTHFGKLVLTF